MQLLASMSPSKCIACLIRKCIKIDLASQIRVRQIDKYQTKIIDVISFTKIMIRKRNLNSSESSVQVSKVIIVPKYPKPNCNL